MSGPLSGIRIVECAGIGPGPFAGMVMADAGADVLLLDRVDVSMKENGRRKQELMNRGRRSMAVDLKRPEGRDLLLRIIAQVDGLIEGFRPGVMERLGLGPDQCLLANERLVYGRVTGWGQDGPLAKSAGHDINFIGLTGALNAIGRKGSAPVPPLNLVGDFGGGGMLLAFGMVSALLEASRSGKGQIVDAAMVDGTALLTTFIHSLRGMDYWSDERESNLIDTGAHFYETYETADGKFMAAGAIEPQFYAEFIDRIGIEPSELPPKMDRHAWPDAKARIAAMFKVKTRDEWCAIFEGSDACVSPVLTFEEAKLHRHNVSRQTFIELDGMCQPAPAPRFSRTPGRVIRRPPVCGEHTDEVLAELGIELPDIAHLRAIGVVG